MYQKSTEKVKLSTIKKTPWELFGIECGRGWDSIIKPLFEYCDKNNIEILQIKEKFGGLRFYTGPAPDEFYEMVREAEEKSVVTCEVCGKPGKNDTSGSWYRTRCEDHKDKS